MAVRRFYMREIVNGKRFRKEAQLDAKGLPADAGPEQMARLERLMAEHGVKFGLWLFNKAHPAFAQALASTLVDLQAAQTVGPAEAREAQAYYEGLTGEQLADLTVGVVNGRRQAIVDQLIEEVPGLTTTSKRAMEAWARAAETEEE